MSAVEIAETHRHEFHLTETFRGRETGRLFFKGACSCGKTETTTADGTQR